MSKCVLLPLKISVDQSNRSYDLKKQPLLRAKRERSFLVLEEYSLSISTTPQEHSVNSISCEHSLATSFLWALTYHQHLPSIHRKDRGGGGLSLGNHEHYYSSFILHSPEQLGCTRHWQQDKLKQGNLEGNIANHVFETKWYRQLESKDVTSSCCPCPRQRVTHPIRYLALNDGRQQGCVEWECEQGCVEWQCRV
jgi:hypothetical protein